jgi:D-3-phosphoglycerate dehydrogenase
MANDVSAEQVFHGGENVEWCTKRAIYEEADIISLHVPLTKNTKNLIGRSELEIMKNDVLLINTARGGIINEQQLFDVMRADHIAGVAIDVFEEEPYIGNLNKLDRCLLTPHMGSMSVDCRSQMEIEATEEAVRYLTGKPLRRRVPETEYQLRENW